MSKQTAATQRPVGVLDPENATGSILVTASRVKRTGMADNSIDATVQLRELWHRIARRWRTGVTVAALCLIAALALQSTTPQEYTATATLTVSPMTTDPFSTSAASQQINIQTEREVLSSSEVARIAAEELGGNVTPGVLLRESTVEAPTQSQVLQVSVSAAEPRQAADYANAMANAYLTFRAQGAIDVASTRIEALDERIAELAESNPSSGRLAELQEERAGLELIGSNPGRIIGIASPPDRPSSLGMPVFLAAGLAGGLLLGAALALTVDLRDRFLRFPERFSEAVGRSVYLLRKAGDAESMRWVLRAVREPFAGSRRTRPIVAAVFGLPGTDHVRFTGDLTATAEAAGFAVDSIPAVDLFEEDLDKPWKYQPGKNTVPGLVIIDATEVRSPSRRANLADGCDVVVLVAGAANRIDEVSAVLANVSVTATRTLVPVFEPGRRVKRGAAVEVTPRRVVAGTPVGTSAALSVAKQ
jgi:capsular polysaccharide biosynthesis protein